MNDKDRLKEFLIEKSYDAEESLEASARATLCLLAIPSKMQRKMGMKILEKLVASVTLAIEAAEIAARHAARPAQQDKE